MSGKTVLRPNQKRAIRYLLQSSTFEEAAELTGVSPRTLNRWMQEPVFLAALRAAETLAIGAAVRGLVIDLQDNHAVIRTIRDDKEVSPGVRLRAAGLLDSSLLRWRGLLAVEEKIEALEIKIDEILQSENS